jgi:hypothetical protein
MNSVLMETEVSVAANGTNSNILTGELYERAPFDGLMNYFSTGSATGLREQIFIAGQAVTGRKFVNIQNRMPVNPDDLQMQGIVVMKGDQIVVRVDNTTAGALTHRSRVDIEPVQFA